MKQLQIQLEHLEQLYTVLIVFDHAGRILHSSDALLRHVPDCVPGSDFLHHFTVMRPARVTSAEQLQRARDALFLIRDREGHFAARGQIIQIRREAQMCSCFCGSPWLYWMNTHRPEVKLEIADFSPQDSQLDQLFMMTTEQQMVGDLEKLNTELQIAKRQTESAQRAKDELFARMSHEMRTPLTGVISALALLSDQPLPGQARELVDLAHSSSRNLLRVINYVLDISRLEVGTVAAETSAFSLSGLLGGVTDVVRARAIEKKLALSWHVSPQLHETYEGDKAMLRQCLLNLVTNAIKFTTAGSVTLRATTAGRGDAGHLRFEVEDTGIGIPPEDQTRIFEPFYTKKAGRDGTDQGTGLGLDIVRRYVEAMGGHYGLSSRPGRGSLFWLEVPMSVTEDLPAETGASTIPRQQQLRGRVLLVDDNTTNLKLGRMILESFGLEVREAQDGASAIDGVRSGSCDLVLMDISMPVMDGVEATREIRQLFSREELPIVALTAYASSSERERCADAGMNAYLTKPIVRDVLAEQLSSWLAAPEEAGERIVPPARPSGFAAPATEEATPATLVDRSILNGLQTQIGGSGLKAVLDQFEGEVRSRWDSLSAASHSGDRMAMTREAHTLGSTCRSLGLTAAGDHFSALEVLLRSKPEAGTVDLHTSEALLTRSLDELGNYRSEA